MPTEGLARERGGGMRVDKEEHHHLHQPHHSTILKRERFEPDGGIFRFSISEREEHQLLVIHLDSWSSTGSSFLSGALLRKEFTSV